MSDDVIYSLQAATGQGDRPVMARNWDKPEYVLQTLADLGFAVPPVAQLAASRGAKVDFAVNRHLVDQALRASTLKTHERIALKIAADRCGFLQVAR